MHQIAIIPLAHQSLHILNTLITLSKKYKNNIITM